MLIAVIIGGAVRAESMNEWSVIDGVDVREVDSLESLVFRPITIPDKFVTSEVPTQGFRAVPNGIVTYRWQPPISNCAAQSIFIPTAGTAWELGYWGQNGWERLGGVGRVSTSRELAVGNEAPALVPLERLSSGPCVLYFVVSNHHYGHGGLWRPLEIGPSEVHSKQFNQSFVLNVLVFSTLFIAGIYHLLLGFLKGHDQASRFFAYLSLILMVRQGSTGFGALSGWIPRDETWSYTVYQHLAFLSMLAVAPVLNRYINNLMPGLLHSRYTRLADITFGGLMSAIVLLPLSYFVDVLPIFHVSVSVCALYVLTRCIRAASKGDWVVRGFVLSLIILTVGAGADIAMVQLGFGNHFILSYCFLGFIATQAYIIARRFNGYLAESQSLASSLKNSLDERERVEGQLHELEDKLEVYAEELDITGKMLVQSQKLAGLGELVASIGHDIGNPLHSLQMGLEARRNRENAIFKAIESILDDSDEAQAFQAHIEPLFDALRSERETAQLSLDRLNSLSMALRRNARLDAEVEPFDIHQVMSDSLLITGHRLRTHQVEIEMTSHAVLLGHASHIGQVFTNLLSNAADALDSEETSGGGQVRIAIHDEMHNGSPSILVTIDDSGPGIPDELRERVLEIFFTTKPSGKGTGLGLAITKRVLDEHDGTIGIERSDKLGGASFQLRFPRREEVRTLAISSSSTRG